MKVILTHDISRKGKAGDVLNVADGYARNYLLPRKYAIIANAYNLSRVENIQREAEMARLELENQYKALAAQLADVKLHFTRKADENDHLFGSVSANDIYDALLAKEIEVHKTFIKLDTHLKNLGEFAVEVNFPGGINSSLKVSISKE